MKSLPAGPKRTSPSPPKLHRNVWATSGTSFLTDVSSEMLLNVLPLFLANVLGVRIWAIGLVEGFAEATSSILKLYSGWLSDRLGTRKWPAVVGYGISAVSKPFYYLASSWGAVAAIRWGDRVGKGVRTAPRDALLADSTPAGRRGLAFGLHRAADTAGAVIGIAVSIWVVQQVQGGGALLEAETFRKLVLWSLVPAFLGVAVLAAGARDVRVNGRGNGGRGRHGSPGAGPAASRPRLRLRGLGRGFGAFVACSVIFELGNSADAFLVLRAQERGLSVAGILWLLLAFNVVYTLVSTPAGSLADRIPRKRVVAAAWGLYALVYLGFALADTAVHVTVLYLVYGCYHGLVAGAAKAMVADLVPPEQRGTAYGGYAAAIGLATLPASLLAGVLWEGLFAWEGFGPAAPFVFGAAMAAVAAVLVLVVVPGEPVGDAG
ncbi:MAG: MFS transporter [Gemmatimonadetes bacterium]|nr:MFS transporter [Gemmatimonadota bacterium]